MNPFAAVLLVDDDVSTNFLTEAALYPLRLTDTYWTAHNGTEALAQLQQHQDQFSAAQPVLVLLDMAMPVLNGMGFLAAFGELPAELRAGVLIIVAAVNMNSADLLRLEDYPVIGTISKPLTAEKLTPILQLYFNGHQRPGWQPAQA